MTSGKGVPAEGTASTRAPRCAVLVEEDPIKSCTLCCWSQPLCSLDTPSLSSCSSLCPELPALAPCMADTLSSLRVYSVPSGLYTMHLVPSAWKGLPLSLGVPSPSAHSSVTPLRLPWPLLAHPLLSPLQSFPTTLSPSDRFSVLLIFSLPC